MSILAFTPADPREQPVQPEPSLKTFYGDLAASVHVPLIAGDLVNAHFAFEQWGQNTDPNRWNHPTYRRAAIKAIRSCSELCRHSAENGAEELALAKFAQLEQALRSVDTDTKTRQSLIREYARMVIGVYIWRLEQGEILSPVEREEYSREEREDGLE